MVEQGIDQRTAIALIFGGAGAGVDHHPGRFVDDGEIVVFVEDVDRNFFGDGAQWRSYWRDQGC